MQHHQPAKYTTFSGSFKKALLWCIVVWLSSICPVVMSCNALHSSPAVGLCQPPMSVSSLNVSSEAARHGQRKWPLSLYHQPVFLADHIRTPILTRLTQKSPVRQSVSSNRKISALLALCAGNSSVTGESPSQNQWGRHLMFSLICVWINGWVNDREAGDLRYHRPHYDVIVVISLASYRNHVHHK